MRFIAPLFSILTLSPSSQAAFILDCGRPSARTSWGTVIVDHNSYKIDFNADGQIYLLKTPVDGTEQKEKLLVNFVDKTTSVYYNEAGNISIAHNKNGVFINVFDFPGSSGLSSECR